jgi:hypothetical protein
MHRGISRRIENLEGFLRPLSASVFVGRAKIHARRTGTSFESAFESLLSKVSDEELNSLTTEFEQIAFGGNTAARDTAKRETLAAAGYPVWNLPKGSRDEGW